MVTLVWRTDVHLADRSPRSRKDTWVDVCVDKLQQVADIAAEVGADAVIDGGDLFHFKPPSKNSHKLVRAAAEVHRRYPCPVYANVGNHDAIHGSYQFIHQQPLGVLFASGVLRPLYRPDDAVVFERDGVSVKVHGVPFHGNRYDLSRFDVKRGEADYLMIAAHMLASATITKMFDGEDVVPYSALAEYEADVFCFGHWHKDQGVQRTDAGKLVVNVGSLTRGTLSEDRLDRRPACVVLRFTLDKVTAERRDLQVKSADEVFNIEAKVQEDLRESALEAFASRVDFALTNTSARDLEAVLADIPDLPPKVRELAHHYIQRAD